MCLHCLSSLQTDVYTCIPDTNLPVSQLMWKGFAQGFLDSQFALHQLVPPVLCSGGQWQHSYGCISLTYFSSADWWVLTEPVPLTCILSLMQTNFQLLFFLVLCQKVVFAASFPCMSVTGILPALYVCVCVCLCKNAHICVYVCLCFRVCECVYFGGLEAAFMSVPSVENGSASEGQPLCCTGLPTLFPKSQMPSSDVGSLLLVHETTTENILYLWDWLSDLSHIPACGREHKWSRLLRCHPILLLSCCQRLLSAVFDMWKIAVDTHMMMAIQAISCSVWGSLGLPQKLKCLCHHVTPKVVPCFTSLRLTVALWLGFVEPDAIKSCVFQPLSCDLG